MYHSGKFILMSSCTNNYNKSLFTHSNNYWGKKILTLSFAKIFLVASDILFELFCSRVNCGMRERKLFLEDTWNEKAWISSVWMHARDERFWLTPVHEKRRKIICTASLLADPISGSTMNRDRRSKYAFYPTGTCDPFYSEYESRAICARTRTVFLYEFSNRALFYLNKVYVCAEATVPENIRNLWKTTLPPRSVVNQSNQSFHNGFAKTIACFIN